MEKFAADKFCRIASNLAALAYQVGGDGRAVRQMPFGELISLSNQLESIIPDLQEIGLKTSELQIADAVRRMREPSGWVSAQVVQLFTCINVAINSEMSTHLFMRIFPERTAFYESPALFGESVAENFPSASRDVKSAGTCYALDRNTASVMHSMRCLEIGLNALADRVGVNFERRNWDNIINDIESEISRLKGGPSAPSNWRDEREFLSGAAKEFRYIKDAWRNHVMHAHEHYDSTEARSILDHVKALVQHLAENGMKEQTAS
jgi:hypothetical protein